MGSYSLTALAADNEGGTVVSTAVPITMPRLMTSSSHDL